MLWWRLCLIYTIWKPQLLWPNTGDHNLQSHDCYRPITCTYSMHSYSSVQSQCWNCAALEGFCIMSRGSFMKRNERQVVCMCVCFLHVCLCMGVCKHSQPHCVIQIKLYWIWDVFSASTNYTVYLCAQQWKSITILCIYFSVCTVMCSIQCISA